MWKPATVADTDGALVALAGGPGQAATPYASNFAAALAPALGTRDLIVFDQRGTGQSGPLSCPGAMAAAATWQQFAEMCSSELGPARDYYTSKDSALDIEAVRQAIGIEKVTIFGVSYGTYVAQLYARLFPTHASMLVLDSVVSPNGVDPFLLSNFASIPSVLAANCSGNLCKGITKNPMADLTRVVQRVGATGLPLRFVDSNGATRRVHASQADLFAFMIEYFSEDAVARSRLPGALRSTLAGDPYPLGRLLAPFFVTSPSTDVSAALYWSTTCSEEHFPWAWSDPVSARESATTNALAAIPAGAFGPFAPDTFRQVSDLSVCSYWPPTAVDPNVTAPFPADIQVLILSGLEDDLTPLADAVVMAAQFPLAVRVDVPFTGHSTISDTWPNADACVARSLALFFTHQPIPACSDVRPFFRPSKRDPSRLGSVKPLGLRRTPGKTLAAVIGTLEDATSTALSWSEPASGLRGGYLNGSLTNVRLHNVVYVPGVVVSGRFNLVTGAGTVTVGGKGSHGKLTILRGKKYTRVRGSLAGKKLNLRLRTSANSATVAVQLPILLGYNLFAHRQLPPRLGSRAIVTAAGQLRG
jgi:pimeloyl-ACP methyl ester carboxylesterase